MIHAAVGARSAATVQTVPAPLELPAPMRQAVYDALAEMIIIANCNRVST